MPILNMNTFWTWKFLNMRINYIPITSKVFRATFADKLGVIPFVITGFAFRFRLGFGLKYLCLTSSFDKLGLVFLLLFGKFGEVSLFRLVFGLAAGGTGFNSRTVILYFVTDIPRPATELAFIVFLRWLFGFKL